MKKIEKAVLSVCTLFLAAYALTWITSGDVLCVFCEPDAAPGLAEESPATSTAFEDETPSGTVRVARVIDGDTIELETGQKLRYIGIDTPESVDPRRPVECFGKEASAKNKELVLNKLVRLEKDVTDTDKYGRLLRYVYVGDTFTNLELVRLGYANASSYPPDIKYQALFRTAEREAREGKHGLWGKCNNL